MISTATSKSGTVAHTLYQSASRTTMARQMLGKDEHALGGDLRATAAFGSPAVHPDHQPEVQRCGDVEDQQGGRDGCPPPRLTGLWP